jgi:hypothetical protein
VNRVVTDAVVGGAAARTETAPLATPAPEAIRSSGGPEHQ